MRSLAEARLKRARAVELAAEGKSYDEIAKLAGYSHRGSAHRAVFQALSEREVEGVEELRVLEAARLDRLQVAIWDKAMAGDLRAVDSALRIIQQRHRLLGLEQGREGRRNHDRSAHLVVGPLEGNPKEATMEDVCRWSRQRS